MPIFEYSGKTTTGTPVAGQIEGKNAEEVKKFLRKQRIIITSLKKKPRQINIVIGTGVSGGDLSRFTRQLATMIEAGLPLVQSLTILAEQTTNKYFAKIIADVRDSVSAGNTFAAALSRHRRVFDELYTSMVEAGEIGGALEIILKRLADYREKTDALKRKVRGALVYPTVIFLASVGMAWFMLTFVIPVFASLFEGLGAQLPAITRFVISLSIFMKNNVPLFILLVILLVVGYKLGNKNVKIRKIFDSAKLKAPIFGDLIRKTAISRFSRTLGTLLQSGVNIVDALTITARSAGNLVIADAIKQAVLGISEGESMTTPLKETGVFPPMVIQMISVGEKTGSLDTMLGKVAQFYDEEVDAAVATLTALIEPVVIIFLGVIVGGLLIAMYLPMFDIIGQIKA